MKNEFKILESLQNDCNKYISDTPNQALIETVSKNGHHLLNIGEHVEAWLLDKYCLIFEDGEMIAGFVHHDARDEQLIEQCKHVYHVVLAEMKLTH
ncbi:MAG: hypothetical protein QM479_04435 [Pseudomonadota bacterium]